MTYGFNFKIGGCVSQDYNNIEQREVALAACWIVILANTLRIE